MFVLLEWARVASQERKVKAEAETAPKVEPAKA
jgi:hypothetical protein